MSFLFGSSSAPAAPAPVPQSPVAAPVQAPVSSAEAEAKRQAVENAAVAQSKAAGRQQTIVAGMKIAQDEQDQRGLLSQSKRRAAAQALGE